MACTVLKVKFVTLDLYVLYDELYESAHKLIESHYQQWFENAGTIKRVFAESREKYLDSDKQVENNPQPTI